MSRECRRRGRRADHRITTRPTIADRGGANRSTTIISPDPFCTIHLAAVRNLWFFQALPVIHNQSELMASEWRHYLHAVYGSLHSEESFPIDLRCFTHWWHKLLPRSKRALFQRHYRPGGLAAAVRGSLVDYSGVSAKHGAVAWQLYLLDDADVTSTMNEANPTTYAAARLRA